MLGRGFVWATGRWHGNEPQHAGEYIAVGERAIDKDEYRRNSSMFFSVICEASKFRNINQSLKCYAAQ